MGDLIDKITILEIKKIHINGDKLENVKKELVLLELIFKDQNIKVDIDLISQLKEVNKQLWKIEDNIRIKESKKEFDNEFIQLARSVYKENDKRAYIKKEINLKYHSGLVEEKAYKRYT